MILYDVFVIFLKFFRGKRAFRIAEFSGHRKVIEMVLRIMKSQHPEYEPPTATALGMHGLPDAEAQ